MTFISSWSDLLIEQTIHGCLFVEMETKLSKKSSLKPLNSLDYTRILQSTCVVNARLTAVTEGVNHFGNMCPRDCRSTKIDITRIWRHSSTHDGLRNHLFFCSVHKRKENVAEICLGIEPNSKAIS